MAKSLSSQLSQQFVQSLRLPLASSSRCYTSRTTPLAAGAPPLPASKQRTSPLPSTKKAASLPSASSSSTKPLPDHSPYTIDQVIALSKNYKRLRGITDLHRLIPAFLKQKAREHDAKAKTYRRFAGAERSEVVIAPSDGGRQHKEFFGEGVAGVPILRRWPIDWKEEKRIAMERHGMLNPQPRPPRSSLGDKSLLKLALAEQPLHLRILTPRYPATKAPSMPSVFTRSEPLPPCPLLHPRHMPASFLPPPSSQPLFTLHASPLSPPPTSHRFLPRDAPNLHRRAAETTPAYLAELESLLARPGTDSAVAQRVWAMMNSRFERVGLIPLQRGAKAHQGDDPFELPEAPERAAGPWERVDPVTGEEYGILWVASRVGIRSVHKLATRRSRCRRKLRAALMMAVLDEDARKRREGGGDRFLWRSWKFELAPSHAVWLTPMAVLVEKMRAALWSIGSRQKKIAIGGSNEAKCSKDKRKT